MNNFKLWYLSRFGWCCSLPAMRHTNFSLGMLGCCRCHTLQLENAEEKWPMCMAKFFHWRRKLQSKKKKRPGKSSQMASFFIPCFSCCASPFLGGGGGNFKSFISCSLPFFQRKDEGFPRKWTRWFQRTSRSGRCCVCGFFWVVSIVWRNVVDLNALRSFATPSIVIGVGPTNAERQLPVALWCVHRFSPRKILMQD